MVRGSTTAFEAVAVKEEELKKPKIKMSQNILKAAKPKFRCRLGFVFLAGSHATHVFPQLACSRRMASADTKEHLTPWE